eukprot:TRINITY_DN5267_c0_g1_i1.p1 TRINITY_DN5267_c0_g1~~TRINITY_DN5267_c0_g1_i1.p1  ORF type:complete len:256 (+),score=60.69 TRINITY_DN5267_c0_g1_i1:73-768(+)
MGEPEEEEYKYVNPLSLLSRTEKKVYEQLNRARQDPQGFAAELEELGQYYVGKEFHYPKEDILVTKEGKPALDETVEFLRAQHPLCELLLVRGLVEACQDHVGDCFANNLVGGRGSDGHDGLARANRYGVWKEFCGENISYGETDAFRVVARLLIDDGLPKRTHRTFIFKPDFRQVGLAGGAHKKFGSQWVMLLAAEFSDRPSMFDYREASLKKNYSKARKKCVHMQTKIK